MRNIKLKRNSKNKGIILFDGFLNGFINHLLNNTKL